MKLSKFWPIFILLALTFILRIVKIEQLFYFTYDESIPAFVGRRLILWQHLPLIGGVTPFNFHLGPYFYWFYALLLAIGKLNPIIWGYAGAAMAILTTFLIYKLGDTIGSKKLALTAAIFWAFSYLANVYDRHLWALYWGPLISLITLISLYKIIHSHSVILTLSPSTSLRVNSAKRKNLSKTFDKFNILLGVTLAFAIHADPSNLVFLALAIVVWIIYKLPIKKSTLIAIGVILLLFTPLIVFDLRHNFANTKPVIDFIKAGRNNPGFESQKFINNSLLFPRAASRLIYPFGDNEIAKQYSYCRNYVLEKYQAIPWYLVLTSSIILIVFVLKHLRGGSDLLAGRRLDFSNSQSTPPKQVVGFRLIAILIVLYFLGIQLYGTVFRADIFEHYITGLFAVLLLIFAKLVSILPKNLWLVVLAIFIVANIYKLIQTQNSMGSTAKRQAIEWTMQKIGDRPFSLDSLSTCWKYNGYRYLFAVFGREPVKSYVDPNFAYLYGTIGVAEVHPETVVVFVVHDFLPETDEFYKRYALLKFHEASSALFGSIEVIVMDNELGWFDK